ncbi:hypothetical protein K3495_g14945 [Podosphaera aphanis]|nr:hypothetical protein K3495_g14945 [Podosphaera aphanis]
MAKEIAESLNKGLIVGFMVAVHLQCLDEKTMRPIKVENVRQTTELDLALNKSSV